MRRTALLAAAALLATLPLTAACASAQKALDCGKLALQISADVADVQTAAVNFPNEPERLGTELDKLTKDLDQLGGQASNADVKQAVTDLRTQADNIRQAVESQQAPDVAPLVSAAGNLSTVCAS
jgi:hypothetical protein